MTPARDPYHWRVGEALSQLFNAAVLNGNPNETTSSRAGREAEAGKPGWIIFARLIDAVFGLYHCKNARGK